MYRRNKINDKKVRYEQNFICLFPDYKSNGMNVKHYIVKGKAFPLQVWTGPWGSWRLMLKNF